MYTSDSRQLNLAQLLPSPTPLMVDLEQAFQLFTTAEVTEGIDISMELSAFKEAACAGKKHANPATVQVLYNGKKLGYDDRTLEKMGVKEAASLKLTVTNMGAIPSDQAAGALRSMGHAPTETTLEEIKEMVRRSLGARARSCLSYNLSHPPPSRADR